MKMKLLTGAAVAAAFAASGAFAQDSGWYGAIDLGGHHLNPISAAVTIPDVVASDGFTARVNKIDFAGFLRLGYRVSPHLRLELEGGYRRGELKSLEDFAGAPPNSDVDLCATGTADPTCGQPDGSIQSYTGMVNALID